MGIMGTAYPPIRSWVDLLRQTAFQKPDQPAYVFLSDGEKEQERLNYRALDERARAIASRLQSFKGAEHRALLLYPSGLEFITAFLGCLYAGVIAVPAPPSHPSRLKRSFGRLKSIVDDSEPSFVLTTGPLATVLETLNQENSEFPKNGIADHRCGFQRGGG